MSFTITIHLSRDVVSYGRGTKGIDCMIFTLDNNHKAELEKLASSGKTPIVIAQKANILLLKDAGKSEAAIADKAV